MTRVNQFLNDYVKTCNAALAGHIDSKRIQNFFADQFISANPHNIGSGKRGPFFETAIEKAYGFYRNMGAQKFEVQDTEITEVDSEHDVAKVKYKVYYLTPDQMLVPVEVEVTYFLRSRDNNTKIFAFVSDHKVEKPETSAWV